MSYITIAGKQCEVLESESYSLESESHNVYLSVLGKRKFNDAFDFEDDDDTRYGQHIGPNFFDTNVGHNCIYKKNVEIVDGVKQKENEILEWCKQYLAYKQLFN